MRLSARNQLTGTVESVDHGVVTSTVKIRLGGGDVITSSLTREAAEELGIDSGSTVTVVIKASDVMVAVAE